MGTTNGQVTTPAAGGLSGYDVVQRSPGWLSGRRGLVVGAAIAAATTALALGQHWLAAADLMPLLFVLPCAVMMFHCMKGMRREARPDGAQTSLQNASNLPASEVKPTEPADWAG